MKHQVRITAENASQAGLKVSRRILWNPGALVTRLLALVILMLAAALIWGFYQFRLAVPPASVATREPVSTETKKETSSKDGAPAAVDSASRPAPLPASALEQQPAEASMVKPPPGTPLALAGIDPDLLRAIAADALAAYAAASNDGARLEAARRIQVAAALGYAPARAFIARGYSRSPQLRAAAAPTDAVRYALDPFTAEGTHAANSERPLAALATYFASRQDSAGFAALLAGAIRDDRRLQTPAGIEFIFKSLADVSGTCAAVARAVGSTAPRGPDCPPALYERLLAQARAAKPSGAEDNARRAALTELQRLSSALGSR